MKKLSAQVQMYIVIALVAVATLAAVFFGIMPIFREASAVEKELASEQAKLEETKAVVKRRQSAKENSAANEVELMRIANRIPDSPQLPGLIIELQDMANAADVELFELTVAEEITQEALEDGTVPPYSTLQVTVSYVGTKWTDVIAFNRLLAELDRGVRVLTTNYTYVAPDAEHDEKRIDGVALIEVYMMDAADLGAPTPAASAATPPAGQ